MSKTIFINLCQSHGVSRENAKNAWEKLKSLADHIEKNWDDIQRLEYMSHEKRLELRQTAAEHGREYTPSELEELIDFISMVKKNINNWKE